MFVSHVICIPKSSQKQTNKKKKLSPIDFRRPFVQESASERNGMKKNIVVLNKYTSETCCETFHTTHKAK